MSLTHFFVPHHKNNHRARILHNASLFTLIVVIAFISSLSVYIHKTHPEVLGISYQVSDKELLNLTNYERAQVGMKPLVLNAQLSEAASHKADYMFEHNFWAHFAPDGTTPWKFIKDAGYDYSFAGENLARGFSNSSDAVTAWMKSPTHKANLLSSKYSDIGFSVKEGKLLGEDTVLIVQMFGNKDGEEPAGEISGEDALGGVVQQVHGTQEQLPENTVMPEVSNSPFVNLTFLSKALTFILLSILLIALILDFVIIKKKNIPRSVGNNLDHIILITIFISFIIMAKIGSII